MHKRNAVTLIELLIVVLILGALAAIVVPRITTSSQTAKENACASNIDIINSQIEMFFVNEGAYPATLAQITENDDYFPKGTPLCPLDGTYSLNTDSRAVCSHSGGAGGGCGG